ncbi:hypothetical protein BH11MYX2_BH11MYX2_26640 [soil metagenome]
MDHRKYMTILKLDDAAIAGRRAFFGIDEDVLARLASLRPLADKITDGIVEDFYALLLSQPRHEEVLRRRSDYKEGEAYPA